MAILSPRRGPAVLAGLAVVALAAVAGCSGKPWVNPPAELLGKPWANKVVPPDPYPDPEVALAQGLEVVRQGQPAPVVPGRPLKVLAVSGGGKFGAYTAGVLCGWTAHGDRPQFDVVTGISSGALTAVYAFLGPKYDARMADGFTTLTSKDIFQPRPVRGLISGDGLASSDPLARRIARELDAEMMAELRAGHRAGRRLFVATTNLTTHRPAVWDVGAVACSGRPDADALVHKILLAACSIPVLVPPVLFEVEVNGVRYCERHADAGAVIQAFIRTADGLPAGSDVYVLTAGKVWRDPADKTARTLGLVSLTVSNALHAIYRAEMVKLHAECAVAGARFHLCALPADTPVNPSSTTFDPAESRMLYDIGFNEALAGGRWRNTAPGGAPDEATIPRTGLEFVAPAPGTVAAPR